MELAVVGSDRPALIDDTLVGLAGYRWRLDENGYVMRKSSGKAIYLHHVVLPGKHYPALVRDHINRDKLDNRQVNLRWLTMAESAQNKNPYNRKHNLGLRGVMPSGRSYRATATLNGVIHRLGSYDDPAVAASVASAWRDANMPFACPDGVGGSKVSRLGNGNRHGRCIRAEINSGMGG